jgi:hypothetical protein
VSGELRVSCVKVRTTASIRESAGKRETEMRESTLEAQSRAIGSDWFIPRVPNLNPTPA